MEKRKLRPNDQCLRCERDKPTLCEWYFFAPSFAQATVPLLQNVIQADGCHVNFGKYTMYAAYGSTTQSKIFPIGFAIIFGNEDKEGWTKFWRFVLDLHPHLNSLEITIITHQDKGSKSAIAAVLPHAFHFHCAWHRLKNIHARCGGGNKTNKAGWLFNLLSKLHTTRELHDLKEKFNDQVIWNISRNYPPTANILLHAARWRTIFTCTIDQPRPVAKA